MSRKVALIHSDGGAKGNPGPSGIGVVITFNNITHEIAEHIGDATNNIAEYTAIIRGLQKALELGATAVEARLDSQLVVRQLGGKYKVKHPGLKPLYAEARLLMQKFSRVSLKHIPREENTHADRLSKEGQDPKTGRQDRVLQYVPPEGLKSSTQTTGKGAGSSKSVPPGGTDQGNLF